MDLLLTIREKIMRKKRVVCPSLRRQLFMYCVLFATVMTGIVPDVYAQEKTVQPISIQVENKPLEQVLKKIGQQSSYEFFYNAELVKNIKVSVSCQDTPLTQALSKALQGTGLQYIIKGQTIVITKKKASPNVVLKGTVTDPNGQALPGVAILVKEENAGAATDIDGNFIFNKPIKTGSILEVSYVGMKSRKLVYEGEENLHIVMVEDAKMLNDVIVTGFQTISRERSTGAATIVNTESLNKIQATTLGSKLEGSVPGLTSYNGQMSIRGISSFAVNSTPLLVLDGQPVSGVNINEINPDDIENVTVLKDAAATSLYGVRASNGVIVITTKKGKNEKPEINISAGFYLKPLPSLSYQHYASTSDIIDYEIEYLKSNPSYMQDPMNYFTDRNDMRAPRYLSQIDWYYFQMAQGNMTQSEVDSKVNALRKNDYRKAYRKALQQMQLGQDYSLSVSKGGEKSNIFFSARYEDYGSYNKEDMSNKFSFYLKNEMQLTNWFKLTLGANASIGKSETGQASYQGATTADAYTSLYNEDGSLTYWYPYNYYRAQTINDTEGLEFMGYNAIEESTKNVLTNKDTYMKLFAHTDINLLKGLDLGLKLQYENRDVNNSTYDEVDSYKMRYMINRFASDGDYGFVYNIPQGGHLSENKTRYDYLNFRAQFNYQATIADKHDLTALLGGEIRQDKRRITYNERYGYDEQKLTYTQIDYATLQSGVVGQLNTGNQTTSEALQINDLRHRYVSAYFNAGYTYDNRYAFNASVRVEQADLFGTDPKYRYRPLWSVGASWNLNNEEFMKKFDWINALKVRMTYGITGNVDQTSSPYLLGIYYNSQYTNASLTDVTTPPNRLLRWEKTSTFNFGVDYMLFNRLNGSIDFYSRISDDLLANKSLDPSTGFDEAKVNNGAMRNTGIEVSISYDWIKSNDWGLTTGLTSAFHRNKITRVGYIPTDALDMMRYPTSYYLEGDTYNSLYAFRYAGLTENGNPSVYDENGEVIEDSPVRNINALVRMGQLDPKWNGALDISLRWKNLSFFTKFVYYAGHKMRTDATSLYSGTNGGAMHEDIVNRWSPSNTDTNIPSMTYYGSNIDREYQWKYADINVTDASFMKCRNIGIQYMLPQNLIKKAGFKQISLRAQVNNPFYWAANNNGIDPEAYNANTGTRTVALEPSYIFGINLNF